MAYKQPTELGMNLGRQSSTDEGLRNSYQAEIVNQLRGNSFQGADGVWGAVDAQRQAQAAEAARAAQAAKAAAETYSPGTGGPIPQQHQQQVTQTLGYNPFASSDGSTYAGAFAPPQAQTLGYNPAVSSDGSTYAGAFATPSQPEESLDQYYLRTLGYNPLSQSGGA